MKDLPRFRTSVICAAVSALISCGSPTPAAAAPFHEEFSLSRTIRSVDSNISADGQPLIVEEAAAWPFAAWNTLIPEGSFHSLEQGMTGSSSSWMQAADPELQMPDSASFLEQIRQGNRLLSYSGSVEDAARSLSEIVSFYCSSPRSLPFYECASKEKTWLELEPDEFLWLSRQVEKADQDWKDYALQVAAIGQSLDLGSNPYIAVNTINDWVCQHLRYEVTNSGMPACLKNRKGQCWHYARLFADLCRSTGIEAHKVQDETHAWNEVKVEGVMYQFDVTKNDLSGQWNRYSWMHPQTSTSRDSETEIHEDPGEDARDSDTASGTYALDPLQSQADVTGESPADPSHWVWDQGSWYWRDADGQLACSQWILDGSKWYYLETDGRLQTSTWIQSHHNWYYVKADGSMATQTWINGHYVDVEGKRASLI